MTVSTPNYHWSMPDPGGSANTWGNLCNGVFTSIDASLWNINANTATFAGTVTVNGALTVPGGLATAGFTNTNGYTVSQASGGSNAYFAMHNNAGTGMGYLYWNPSNQVVLVNQTGGGDLILNPDGSASVSGSLSSQGLNTTSISCSGAVSCSNLYSSGLSTFAGFTSVGNSSISGSLNIGAGGNLTVGGWMAASGTLSRNGISGSNGGNQYNHFWTGSQNHLYVNDSDWGQIQTNSDYRMKKDIEPLGSMWGTVKALNPISYTHKDWTPPSAGFQKSPSVVADNVERWGFLAHELQETLVESAAHGVKDDPVCVQSPNPFTVIAALTRALQEAMTRIEALEAAR